MVALCVAVVPLGRDLLKRRGAQRWLAEWEAAAALLAVGATGLWLAACPDLAGRPWIVFPVPERRLLAATLVGAALVLVTFGGTHIVRGVLGKAGQVKGKRTGSAYRGGRLIGTLERLLLVLVVMVGSYEALGFIVAAKGLIRVKEFEDQNFAEYFIVGSLASVLLALVVGVVLGTLAVPLWTGA